MRKLLNGPGVAALLAAFAIPAHAHPGEPIAPHDLWAAWSLEPGVLFGLGLAAWLYARGLQRLWGRSARGRGIRQWEATAFTCGWVLLALSLISPLHALGDVLFSAHMAQHTVLIAAAAPLLVLGRPVIPSLWALPQGWRRTLGGWTRAGWFRPLWAMLTRPLVAFLLHAVALWGWHLPALYQESVRSEWVLTLQHVSFLGTALLFWWAMLHGRSGRAGYGVAVFFLFATLVHSGALGALLTFAPSAWYPIYGPATVLWGLTPLEDQQLAGLIMWVPAGAVYLGAGLTLFALWLGESERRTARAERVLLRSPQRATRPSQCRVDAPGG